MNLLTLGDVREVVAEELAGGSCPESAEVLRRINVALRWLWEENTYLQQKELVCYRLDSCCLVLDREHAALDRALRFKDGCCGFPVELKNRRWKVQNTKNFSCCVATSLTEIGTVPVHRQLPEDGGPWRLMAMSERKEDDGVSLRVEGLDVDGKPVFWYAETGENIPIASNDPLEPVAPVYSQWAMSRVTAVTKSKTRGYVWLYGYNPVTEERVELARYHPLDRTPAFAAYEVQGMCECPTPENPIVLQGFAIPAFREVHFDWDVLPVQSLHAVLHRARAEELEKLSADAEEYRLNLQSASILNNKSRSRMDRSAKKVQEPSTDEPDMHFPYEGSPGQMFENFG